MSQGSYPPPQWNNPQPGPYQPPQRNTPPPPYNTYQPPFRPGQYQPPPYPPFNTPPPQQRQSGLWPWFKRQTRGAKIGLGCGLIVAILFLCICSTAALGATLSPVSTTRSSQVKAITETPIATSATTFIVGVTPTIVPTVTPTHKPAPTPTATPLPTPTPKSLPTPKPTPIPAKPTPCADSCNPWGYNFTPGNLIYNPPADFCSHFPCIPSFWEPDDPGDGYVVVCADGLYSQSGEERGACSRHGGVNQPLYAH